jgi:predicted enzyme related to lactoylglutathione lyase
VEKVTGIGGFFFRATDPDALAQWYSDNLGVDPVPTSEGGVSWWQQAGPTAFTAMEGTVDQFGDPNRAWAVNFRVSDLDAMVVQLRDRGIEISDPESYPIGSFASLADPEGNPIQLWQPSPEDLVIPTDTH